MNNMGNGHPYAKYGGESGQIAIYDPQGVSAGQDKIGYEQGSRRAWLQVLSHCLIALGVEDVEAGNAHWILEREATVVELRGVCERYGDNDWPNNLHLADVIEKHLKRHLET